MNFLLFRLYILVDFAANLLRFVGPGVAGACALLKLPSSSPAPLELQLVKQWNCMKVSGNGVLTLENRLFWWEGNVRVQSP